LRPSLRAQARPTAFLREQNVCYMGGYITDDTPDKSLITR
jgi:hypothetical protein